MKILRIMSLSVWLPIAVASLQVGCSKPTNTQEGAEKVETTKPAKSQPRQMDYLNGDPKQFSFKASDLEISADEISDLQSALVRIARDPKSNNDLRAKAIVIALRIDPEHREVFETEFELRTKGTATAPETPWDRESWLSVIKKISEKAPTEATPAQLEFRIHVLDVAAAFEPSSPDLAFEFHRLKNAGVGMIWNRVFYPDSTMPIRVSLPRTQSKIKGLLVQELEASRFAGLASQMNATASEVSIHKPFKAEFNQKVGEMMESALHEVVKYLSVRHKGLPEGYLIELAFENQYSPKDGPSAAVACGLLIESLLTGVEFDPDFAVTGNINADGVVQPVGGIDGKIRGATNKGCKIIAIPAQNEVIVPDLLIQAGPEAISQIQIISIEKFDDALAVAVPQEMRDSQLQQAIDEFTLVQGVINKPNGMSMLKNPHVIAKLQSVVELTPSHLSARYLLQSAQNKDRKVLTLVGSLQYIDIQAEPMIRAIRQGNFSERSSSLDVNEYSDTYWNLKRVRSKLDPRTWMCADAIIEYAHLMSEFVKSRPNSYNNINKAIGAINAAGSRVVQEYDTLESRLDVREELIR